MKNKTKKNQIKYALKQMKIDLMQFVAVNCLLILITNSCHIFCMKLTWNWLVSPSALQTSRQVSKSHERTGAAPWGTVYTAIVRVITSIIGSVSMKLVKTRSSQKSELRSTTDEFC